MPEDRRLAAIMFTDIVGYTALMDKNEDAAFKMLRKNREVHKYPIENHNGEMLKEMGDGILASFNSASDAVRCAGEIQCEAKKESIPLRIGIHEGEVVFERHDVFGDGVNVASRLEELAEEGCIYISGAVYKDIKNKVGITAEFIEEKFLKNVEETVKVYKVCCKEIEEIDTKTDTHSQSEQSSIAVMPFVNISADPEQEYFCDGISEELLNGLAHIENLKVAARTSSFSFKGKDVDIVDIGQKLNVNTVLEGSVRKSGNRLRVTAQLINIADGFHLWSERYDRQMDDIFDIQDEISLAIIDTLKVKLIGEEKDSLIKRGTENQEAYQLYLNGLYHRNKTTPEGFFTAIEYFKRATKVNPNYAEAYSGMAVTYFYLYNYSILPPHECIPQLSKAVERTLELDNANAEGHLAKGMLNFWYRWDFDKAEIAYRRSVELNPNHAEAHANFGMFLGMMGRRAEAHVHAEKARELDPFTALPTLTYIGWIYFLTGDFDLLEELTETILELDSPWFGHAFLGFKYWMAKRYQEAVSEFELSTRAKLPLTHAWLGCVLGIMGEKEKAQSVINTLHEMGKHQHIGAYNLGLIYLGMGENDKAFEHFNIGCDKEHDGILLFLKQKFKLLPGLKGDPRMDDIVAKFGLPDD